MNFKRSQTITFCIILFSSFAFGQSPTLEEFLNNDLSSEAYEKDKTLLITLNSKQPSVFQKSFTFQEFIEDVIDVEHPEAYDEDNLDAYYAFFDKWFDKNYHRIRVCKLGSENCAEITSLAGFVAFYPFLTHNRPSNSYIEAIDNESNYEVSIHVMMELQKSFFDFSPKATQDLLSVKMEAKQLYSKENINLSMMGYFGYYLTLEPENTNFLTLYNRFYTPETQTDFNTGRAAALKTLSSQKITEAYFYKSLTMGKNPIYELAYKNGYALENKITIVGPGMTTKDYKIKNTNYSQQGDVIKVTEYDFTPISKYDFEKIEAIFLSGSSNGVYSESKKMPEKTLLTPYLNQGKVLSSYGISTSEKYKYCLNNSYKKNDSDTKFNFNFGAQSYANDFSSLASLEIYVENCEPTKIVIENRDGLQKTLKITDFRYDTTFNKPGLTEDQKNEIRRKLGYPTTD